MIINSKANAIINLFNRYFFLSLSGLIWIHVLKISVNLKPIADEVCVLSEWPENSILPPFHSSPRVFGSLFTWLLAPIWRFQYSLGFLLIILISSALIYKLHSRCFQYLTNEVPSIKSKLTFTTAASPWILFALPPNKTALFDSVFWFGGSWHLIGALIVSYSFLLILTQDRSGHSFYFWILLASFWSETSASVMFVVLFLNIKSDKRCARAIFMPIVALALNLIVNVSNNRISTVHQGDLRNNLSILKGSIRMIVEYGLSSLFIAIVLITIFFSHSLDSRKLPTKKFLWIFLFTGSVIVLIYLVGYPTWRSSSIIGVLFLILLILSTSKMLQKPPYAIASILITLVLGFNTISNLESIESVAIERSDWWSNSVMSNDKLLPFEFSEKIPDFFQADYGSSDWIDSCFNNLDSNTVG